MSAYHFFDRLEDKTRGFLSHYPILYAFVAGGGVVLCWRGIWHTADGLFAAIGKDGIDWKQVAAINWHDGPLSLVIGTSVLLLSGAFVYSFIGNEIIISGLKREKKISEKTEAEVMAESIVIEELRLELAEIKSSLKEIKEQLAKKD